MDLSVPKSKALKDGDWSEAISLLERERIREWVTHRGKLWSGSEFLSIIPGWGNIMRGPHCRLEGDSRAVKSSH